MVAPSFWGKAAFLFCKSFERGYFFGAVFTPSFIWQAPDASEWGILVLLAAIAVASHFLIALAYTMAEASLLVPLSYTEMIMATLAGSWLFGETPDGWIFFGVIMLIACMIYTAIRQRVRRIAVERDFAQP